MTRTHKKHSVARLPAMLVFRMGFQPFLVPPQGLARPGRTLFPSSTGCKGVGGFLSSPLSQPWRARAGLIASGNRSRIPWGAGPDRVRTSALMPVIPVAAWT